MRRTFPDPVQRKNRPSIRDADAIAVEVLAFLASDDERLERFFSVTGLDVEMLRAAAGTVGFAESMLDYLTADETLLVAFAETKGYDPGGSRRCGCRSRRPPPIFDGCRVLPRLSGGICRACADPVPVLRVAANHGASGIVHLAIAHVDCDAFYAAVEKRDDPSLRDKAVIIGGSRRGVVLTACYNARIHGVRSAMPMFKALKLCPHATIVRPDMAKYVTAGRAVRAMMNDLTPLIQPLSIDEAFLDLSGTEAVHGAIPAVTLARFAARVEREIGITVSIGLSDCKFLAKLASDVDKPRGYTIIGRAEAIAYLRPRPVGAIWGVGAVTQARLGSLGFLTIGDIQDCTEAEFAKRIGSEGMGLWRLAHARDTRPVSTSREAKSVSAETTFTGDLAAADDIVPIPYHLCEKVALRLATGDLAAGGIVLKLKTKDFRLKTRSRSPIPPTQLAARLFEAGRGLLLPELDGTMYRLIGLGTSDLRPKSEADQADLIDTTLQREKATARAIDAVRAKFGGHALMRGITMGRTPKRR